VAWLYTVVLAACSAGILATGVVLTRRLFRDETLLGEARAGDVAATGTEGAAP
jgi:hypothetical protein